MFKRGSALVAEQHRQQINRTSEAFPLVIFWLKRPLVANIDETMNPAAGTTVAKDNVITDVQLVAAAAAT